MATARTTITLYFDCLSPFSLLAFTSLRRYTSAGGPWATTARLDLKAVLLGGIMASARNTPPAVRPWAKATAKVSVQDFERNKAFFNVPNMKPPPSNFFGPGGPADPSGLARDLRYMRLVTAVSMRAPEALAEVARGVFAMIHTDLRASDGRVEVTEERLEKICTAAGLSPSDAHAAVASVTSSEVKNQLKRNVEEALSLGAFGAPFFVVGDQAYFGSDRLEQMAFTHGLPWHGPDPSRPTATMPPPSRL